MVYFKASLITLLALPTMWLKADPATDWPQFLGPQRNGTYTGTSIAKTWPKEGLPILWQRQVGQGFSGPAVSGNRVILFHRTNNQAVVECMDARTGRELWKGAYPTDYRDDFGFDEGPRATPAIADGRVFTFGAEGRLSCWKLETGGQLWSVDTVSELGSLKGFFGRVCSPLVEGDLVILTPGGQKDAGIVAFDAANGKVRWKATEDEASYSSPIAVTINGQRVLLVLNREALVALHPKDGKVIFRYPWRPPMNA
jgi:outer membrane protein assembly factor BamB